MTVIAFDTETALIRPGRAAPELVCLTYCIDGGKPAIVLADEAAALMRAWLLDPSVTLAGHNIAFDEAVMSAYDPSLVALFFAAHEAARITDTMLRERLISIAAGQAKMYYRDGAWHKTRYDLGSVSAKYCGGKGVNKEDPWRLRYSTLMGVPLVDWPDDAKGYALEDARVTYAVFDAQEKAAPDPVLRDQFRQTYAAWAFQLISVWGLRTDEESVREVERGLLERKSELLAELTQAGLVRGNGTRDTKRAAQIMHDLCKAKGIAISYTKSGPKEGEPYSGISLDADACARVEEPLMAHYADWSTVSKMLSNDVAMLRKGMHEPIHTRFFLAETGRSTSSGPNVQNVSKKLGVREGFVPRRNHVYLQCDIPGLELHTLAECCHVFVGHSKLAEALKEGIGPHDVVAGQLLSKPYEWVLEHKGQEGFEQIDEMRQLAKALNFGLPGGLGADRFIDFARAQYHVSIDKAQFKEYRTAWMTAWPEMSDYFAHANMRIPERGGTCMILQPYSQRVRGRCSYTVACNGPFQALGADLAKAVLCELSRRCYVDETSSLYGSRIVNFVHDEYILEIPEDDKMHERAQELADVIVEFGNRWIPHAPFLRRKFEPLLMRRWAKKAKPVHDANGRLIVWEG